MKILIVAQNFWPESFVINDIARSLVEEGCEILILTAKPNYPSGVVFAGYTVCGLQTELWHEISVFRVPIVPRGNGNAFRLALNYLSFVVSSSVIAPWLFRKHNIDLVFVFGTSPIFQAVPGLLLARIKNAPLIIWVQDLWPESLRAVGVIKNDFLLSIVGRMVASLYESASRLLVQSPGFGGRISKCSSDELDIHYFPNPYFETQLLEPSALPNSVFDNLNFELQTKFTIVFAGNLGLAQSIETIAYTAELLKSYENIRFVLVGNGTRRRWLECYKEEKCLTNLILMDRVPKEQIELIYKYASALLVTLKSNEAMDLTIPSKVQAYMAAGKPILASLDGVAANIITETNVGFHSPAGNPYKLASNILKLSCLEKKQQEEMGKRARKYFENNFHPNKLVPQLYSHFLEVRTRFDKERSSYKK